VLAPERRSIRFSDKMTRRLDPPRRRVKVSQ
jgi:hypothetical protein